VVLLAKRHRRKHARRGRRRRRRIVSLVFICILALAYDGAHTADFDPQEHSKETDSRGRTVGESKASDGLRYAGARSGVGRRVTERYETKVIRLYRWVQVQVVFLLQEHSKHQREMVITPKAKTSTSICTDGSAGPTPPRATPSAMAPRVPTYCSFDFYFLQMVRRLGVVAPLLTLCSCEWFVLLSCACACDLLIF